MSKLVSILVLVVFAVGLYILFFVEFINHYNTKDELRECQEQLRAYDSSDASPRPSTQRR